jgi:hypothetical protein
MYNSPFEPHMWSVINALSRSGASSRLPSREKEEKRRKDKFVTRKNTSVSGDVERKNHNFN